jgi:ABC-type branched-subunit amino acid transport system ATPase component
MLLEVNDISKHFGGVRALHEVSLCVEAGHIFGLVGPNGSGKTTLVNVLSGFLKPDSGTIRFEGQNIQSWAPYRIARLGLCRTFQITLNPSRMTVMENMLLGPRAQRGESLLRAALEGRAVRADEAMHLDRAWALLARMRLERHADELAGALSGGQKKLLALAQVLMAEPKLILLDEPVAGVNPRLIEDIIELLLTLRTEGHNFLVIEHNMQAVRRLCDRICVLDMGQVLAEGPPHEVLARDDVLRAYIAAGGEVSAGGDAA